MKERLTLERELAELGVSPGYQRMMSSELPISQSLKIEPATSYNLRHASKWGKDIARIIKLVGLNITPSSFDDPAFAEAIALWQKSMNAKYAPIYNFMPMDPDGKLGPRTWARMEIEMGRDAKPEGVPLSMEGLKKATKGLIRCTSPFGPRVGPKGPELHGGIDIGCPSGVPVRATMFGEIVKAGWQCDMNHSAGAGLYVMIQNAAYVTVYGHLQEGSFGKEVEAGKFIERGTVFARADKTGACRGINPSHLHYEVRERQEAEFKKVDPTLYGAIEGIPGCTRK